jgi:hypothetical protein
MFANATPLKFAEHGDLRVLESNDYAYARGEILASIALDELSEIAREYTIVFPSNGSDLPAALLGLESGQNVYVADDGHWFGTYVPAMIRRYPFALTKAPGETDPTRFTIVFAPDAPHFHQPNGHAVFTAAGQMTDHMARRLELLKQLQHRLPVTQRLVRAIDAAGVLVEKVIRIQRGDKQSAVTGLRVVDEKKLNALPHDQFAALRDAGALPLVYAHLISWANFRQGPLAGKYPELAAKPKASNPEFLFEEDRDDDMIDFSKLI